MINVKKYYTDVCVICIINEPNKLYIPCGHVCICNVYVMNVINIIMKK